MVREGRVLISVATDPDFGSGYSVTAYEVGAQVTTGGTTNTPQVRTGHGFAAGDKFIVGTSTSQFKTVLSVTATQLTLTGAETVTVAAGDILINLAADTGSSTPNYNGNGLAVYTDMAYASQATNNTVTTDATGNYRYFYNNIPIWELVRTSLGVPIAYYLDTGVSGIGGPTSSTDNAVARFDGTNGQLIQNSVVIIADTSGNMTGVGTLAVGGALTAAVAVTVGTTLGVTGTSTLAAVNASGTVAAAGAVTVGTTLGVTGAATLSAAASVGTTLTVTGATSLGSTLAVTGDTTISGHNVRSVAAAVTAAATPNNTQAGGTVLNKDINNVATCATAGNAVTMPTAVAGMMITIFNNGVASCAVFPASGASLGVASANASVSLASQANITYVAFSTTKWEPLAAATSGSI